MNEIPDAAVEAAAEATQRAIEGWMNYDDEDWTLLARAALSAAMPAIREALAQEIEAAHNERVPHLSLQRIATLDEAARIVRGGTR